MIRSDDLPTAPTTATTITLLAAIAVVVWTAGAGVAVAGPAPAGSAPASTLAGSAASPAAAGGADFAGGAPATAGGADFAGGAPATAGGADFAGGAPATATVQDAEDADATIVDGRTYWRGQVLNRSRGIRSDATVDLLTGDGEFVRQFGAGADGEVVFETAELDPGEYVLESEDGQVASFSVRLQNVSMGFAGDTADSEGADARVDLTVESERGDFVQHLTATLDGEPVAPATLRDVLGEGTAVDTDGDGTDDAVAVAVPGTGSLTLTADFAGLAEGTFRLSGTPADAQGTAEASIAVGQAPATASIDAPGSAVADELGDVVRLPVALSGTDRARVIVGSADAGYRVELTAVDGDGDGRVVVLWNTHRAGHDAAAAFGAAGGDGVRDVERTDGGFDDPGESIPARQYDLAVSVGGDQSDAGFVDVRSPGAADRGVQILRAPADRPAEAVPDAATGGVQVAADDWLVVRVGTGGVFGYVEETADLGGTAGVSLELVPERSSAPTIGVESATAVFRPAENAIFVLFDTAEDDRFQADTTYAATFAIDAAENPHLEESVEVTTEVSVRPRTATIAGDEPLSLAAEPGQTVGGSTPLADGTTLTVVVGGDADALPVEREVTVRDGTFEAEFDLSDVPPGTELAVEIREGDRRLADAPGAVEGTGSSEDEAATPGPTEGPTPTATPEDDVDGGDDGGPTATDEPSDTGAPGFGIAGALLALAAGALLARRRR